MEATRIAATRASLRAVIISLFLCPMLSRAEFTVEIQASDPDALRGAVIVARPSADSPPSTQPAAPQQAGGTHRISMEQINRQFEPYILPVPIGVPVEFPNRDRTAHHVYSFSAVHTFELPLYRGDLPEPIQFNRPGVVPLGCNIHDWMIGYIYVVDTPLFTQLEAAGAVFDDLPEGDYEISIWHPALRGQESPSWPLEVTSSSHRAVFSLPAPILAASQPKAPIERFDESRDY